MASARSASEESESGTVPETLISSIRVLIVDDHTTFVELLADAINREPQLCSVGTADSVQGGVEQFAALCPDVVVMDYHLSDGSGLDAAARILADSPSTRIIMLTGDPTAEALERAAAIGICAFLPKDGSLATMLSTLRHARTGGILVHPSLLVQFGASRSSENRSSTPALTLRELEVLQLMSEGSDVRTNARLLGIAENTCRGYVKSILAKLGAHSQLEAVVTAHRFGLIRTSARG